MENVIKQGYLKRGSSSENRLSGIFDKFQPKKWYMLVVRSRVPFLEQYERDVDVFSGSPVVSYDLSTCTAVSHTMGHSSRTFNFVISFADHIIELTAATREQMIEWCDVLQRTLSSLGFLKRDIDEHIYTVCPAVVFSGRTKEKKDDDNILGAIGGAPAPPPPRQSGQDGKSTTLVKFPSEPKPHSPHSVELPPLPLSMPPPLPKAHPPSPTTPTFLTKARSPSPLEPPDDIAPPPPVRKQANSPASPVTKTLHSQSDSCGFLPSGQQVTSTTPISDVPPPLPKGRSHAKVPPTNTTASSVSAVKHHKIISDIENADSDTESTDYSSDFVSGAFWEINRKIPVPTARHAVLASDKGANAFKHTSTSARDSVGEENSILPVCAEFGDPSFCVEELDEGYSDLKIIQSLNKKSQTIGHLERKFDQNGSADIKRSASLDALITGTDKTLPAVFDQKENTTVDPNTCDQKMDSCSDNAMAVKSNEPETDAGFSENFYSLYPLNNKTITPENQDDDRFVQNISTLRCTEESNAAETKCSSQSSSCTSSDEENAQPEDMIESTNHELNQYEDMSKKNSTMESSGQKTNRQLPTPTSVNSKQDHTYFSVCDASSLSNPSLGPPLPPRLDSLPFCGKRSVDESGPMNVIFESHTDLQGAMVIPLLPRKGHEYTAADEKMVSQLEQSRISKENLFFSQEPPSLPPRRNGSVRPVSMISVDPPPLPERKSHSFKFKRPSTSPNFQINGTQYDKASGLWYPGCENDSPKSTDELPGKARPQQGVPREPSITETHLKQRMRLDRTHSLHSVVSLKQSQAEILQQEMELPGVTVSVTQFSACGIAFVDCNSSVCIAGWNQKDFPSLHSKFHIGDQVISICNVRVTTAAQALKLLKNSSADVIEMLIKRMPHAKVLAIRRSAEGESIGIKRNGGTGEILYVDPNGLAANNGLPQYAQGILSEQRSNWMLTEINSRHLSLFFKDMEIEHRLNAVGREITIVVQPSDYIFELKKQLKKLKNYKSFIVQ